MDGGFPCPVSLSFDVFALFLVSVERCGLFSCARRAF